MRSAIRNSGFQYPGTRVPSTSPRPTPARPAPVSTFPWAIGLLVAHDWPSRQGRSNSLPSRAPPLADRSDCRTCLPGAATALDDRQASDGSSTHVVVGAPGRLAPSGGQGPSSSTAGSGALPLWPQAGQAGSDDTGVYTLEADADRSRRCAGLVAPGLDRFAFVGELALDGRIRPVAGLADRHRGPFGGPGADPGLRQRPGGFPGGGPRESGASRSLARSWLTSRGPPLRPTSLGFPRSPLPEPAPRTSPTSRVKPRPKRGLETAAAGGHNCLFVGSPG